MKRTSSAKYLIASVSSLIVSLCFPAWADETGAISISVIDSEDADIGVLSAVLSGTAALAQEATTDPNGKVRLPRQCKPGEQIQAKPVEEVVYEPSGAVTCSSELQIKVRRRPFADSGVIAFSAADFLANNGGSRLAITKIMLARSFHTLEPQSGSGPSCEISFMPETSTIIYDEKGNMTFALVKELRDDKSWNEIPRTIKLGTHCDDAQSSIQELTHGYIKEMAGKAEREGFGSTQWLIREWATAGQSGYFLTAADNSKSATWVCVADAC